MSLPWRWCLVVMLAATVLGGFMPRALLAGGHPVMAGTTALAAEGPPTFPSGCTGDNCGRSAPVAPVPVLTIAALVAFAGIMTSGGARRTSRRIRSQVHALPRGAAVFLFRPPRFS